MKIRELSIKNCLSFGDKGLNQDNAIQLGDFNLFIGSNNAGKSNVLKFMEILKLVLQSVRERGNEALQNISVLFEGQPRDWVFAQKPNGKLDFSFSVEIEQTDQTILNIIPYNHEDGNPVLFMFGHKKNWPKTLKVAGFIEYKEEVLYVAITKVEIPNDHQAYREKPILFDRKTREVLALKPEFDEKVWKVVSYPPSLESREQQWASDYSPVGKATLDFLNKLYDKVFKDLLVNIGAIREIKLAGDEVSETLDKLRNGKQDEHRMFASVQKFINELIFSNGGQNFELRFPGASGGKRIEIAGGELVLPLSHYGSSVEQMLTLATKIVQHGSNKVLLIEEPEAHFHPDLQRKFLRFLRDNQENFNHQYLIATHSNIFVDEFTNMQEKVYYVHSEQDEGSGPKYSQVELLDKDKLLDLFMDLGVRPSDLLFANGLLVVEGIIDKDVYADWARKTGKAFDKASIIVIDAEGAGNIKKYLLSEVIQRTCFKNYALFDKNAEDTVKKAVEGIVPDENVLNLEKGDIEDYYPRDLVLDFARELATKKGRREAKIPSEIKEGKTVETLSRLLKGDWWKRNLADKIIEDMKPEQIDDEIRTKLSQIYDSVC